MTTNAEFKEKLLTRTLMLSENLIFTANKLPNTTANMILVRQIIRSGTSIGANYREACEAESAKDFVHKIKIAKKESKETSYWLELLIKTNNAFEKELISLLTEVNEFTKIFSKISLRFK